jgi:K+-sensing histidine kinase KdpD
VPEIPADGRKVNQVLVDLLSNAVKFTPKGGLIDVRAGVSGGMAEIFVTDTGVGIALKTAGGVRGVPAGGRCPSPKLVRRTNGRLVS